MGEVQVSMLCPSCLLDEYLLSLFKLATQLNSSHLNYTTTPVSARMHPTRRPQNRFRDPRLEIVSSEDPEVAHVERVSNALYINRGLFWRFADGRTGLSAFPDSNPLV